MACTVETITVIGEWLLARILQEVLKLVGVLAGS